jgi:lysophospholipase L1-like esterase
MPRWTWIPLAAASAVAGYALATTAWRFAEARELARASEPFRRDRAEAQARVLVVGDSTGVGTGAPVPGESVAGRIAARYPDVAIDNRSRDGARFADVRADLDGATGPYAMVLVQAGGNDVLRLTGEGRLALDVDAALARARRLAPVVVVMPPGNVGIAPFFWPPASWWMSARARRMHAIVRDAAARRGATYVGLYRERADDPFARDPRRMYAADGLHPSGDGYAQWTGELVRQADLDRVLAPR